MRMDTSALAVAPKQSYSDEELRKIWLMKVLNVKATWQEFELKKLDLSTMPFKGIVELTQNCNFRCLMCPQSWEEKFQKYNPDFNMPMETFVKIADQLFPHAIFIDLRGFGETTILPYWPDVVDYLERFPYIEWHLVTNLSLPRDDVWDKMMRLGFALGASIDGATKETFEAIRVRGHFDRIRHNLGVIRDSIRRHDMGWIYFISTIQKKNVHELRKLVELAREFDVLEVQFKIVQDGPGHAEGIRDLDRESFKAFAGEAVEAALALDIRVTFNDWLFTRDLDPEKVARAALLRERPTPHIVMNETGPYAAGVDAKFWVDGDYQRLMDTILDTPRVAVHQRCFKPFSFTYLNYKAEMGTCNHMMYPDMLVMGDLKKQTVKEIWNSPRYQEFRRQLAFAEPQDPRCQWCFKHRLDD